MPAMIWQILNVKPRQPETEVMWICRNFHGKTREIPLGELMFWRIFDIWNHCGAGARALSAKFHRKLFPDKFFKEKTYLSNNLIDGFLLLPIFLPFFWYDKKLYFINISVCLDFKKSAMESSFLMIKKIIFQTLWHFYQFSVYL